MYYLAIGAIAFSIGITLGYGLGSWVALSKGAYMTNDKE